MFALTIMRNDIKSSTAFHTLLQQTHAPELKRHAPVVTKTILDAPQGWDHALFGTEVLEKTWGNTCSYSWRACLREQPFTTEHDPVLSVSRPYIVILVDDCLSMNSSCGKNYDDEMIFLERPDKEIVPAPYRDDVDTYLSSHEGTYFRGDYGNTYYRATDTFGFGGTLPTWAFVQSYITVILEDLDLCEIAIATTSKGIVAPFTRDHAAIRKSLAHIQPDSAKAPLSEALVDLLDVFPDNCITSRHIIVATSGIAIDDGNLPSWLKDFDNDGNALDSYVDGPGSHCLDDVAAYASTLNISVHTVGPDSVFLKNVAQKGNGQHMPSEKAFETVPDYICQMRTSLRDLPRFLANSNGAFDPGWLIKTSALYYQAGPYDPLSLTGLPRPCLSGPATSHFANNTNLLCSTSKDYLLSVNAYTGDLAWVVKGIGGKIARREGIIIAGPDRYGYIHALSGEPSIQWRHPGDLFEASRSCAYIARGNAVTSISLQSGQFLSENTTGSDITSLLYDPCEGIVLAGTSSGMIHIFNQDLFPTHIITTNAPGAILDIHTFDWRKTLYIIAFSQDNVMCMTLESPVWSFTFSSGTYSNAAVMDSRLYITTWSMELGCEGIDTGRSHLATLDALTGEQISQSTLFAGKAFGPLIALEQRRIEYNSWDMAIAPVDISALEGTNMVALGSRRTDRAR